MSTRSAKSFLLLLLFAMSPIVLGAEAPAPPDEGPTPPRLSHIDGQASFWRTGAEDWTPARVNMPLAAGDRLYTGQRASLEVQVGPRAFVRAAERTEIGFVSVEPDLLQLELKDGTASLDLRSLPAGYRVELNTPHAVFTIEHSGYYRSDVNGEATHFITRRAGRATVIFEGVPSRVIMASEEIVVNGTTAPTVTSYVAPEPDAWDRWNYARTDHEVEAVSSRYVAPGVYGVGALDQHGRWRMVPDYGHVWVPDRVAPDWVPYSAGSWVWDRYYGWSWVDDAPWGWAPFHYGRWVHVGGYWGWAPGPVIVRPVYAPALVAFFGIGHGVSVRFGIRGPGVGWIALGWGEPLRPWWGRRGFVGVPWWGGWGGPRIVNNVVIDRRTVINVNTIVYRNTRVRNAVVALGEDQFGAGRVRTVRLPAHDPKDLQPIADAHPVKPRPTSLNAATGPAARPPATVASRPVVTTRPPRTDTRVSEPEKGTKPTPGAPPREDTRVREPDKGTKPAPPAPPREAARVREPEKVTKPTPTAPPRVITPPKPHDPAEAAPRPSFGERGLERPRPPQPPQRAAPRTQPPREARPTQADRGLPGRPANALSPRRAEPERTPGKAAPTAPHRK